MTAPIPLPDDELVSAYLDGAVDDAERARVENRPDLLARADQLAATRHAVATNAPRPDPAQRERHIGTVLAMLDTAAPVSLADRQARRTRRAFAVLAAAAAIVAIAGFLAVLANRSDHHSIESTAGPATATTAAAAATTAAGAPTAADSKAENAASTTAAAASGGATDVRAPASTAFPQPAYTTSGAPDLGALDAESAPGALRGATRLSVPAPPGCPLPGPGSTHFVGTATYAGTPVFAFVTDDGATPARGVLIDAATCVVVADVDLA